MKNPSSKSNVYREGHRLKLIRSGYSLLCTELFLRMVPLTSFLCSPPSYTRDVGDSSGYFDVNATLATASENQVGLGVGGFLAL